MKTQTSLRVGVCMGIPRGTVDMWAGPLWSDTEAQQQCPGRCEQFGGGKFTGQWRTPEETWGKNSVCNCEYPLAC